MNEQRLSAALNRPVNLHHERTEDILIELLTYVEQYKTEYQETVHAIRKHLVKWKIEMEGFKLSNDEKISTIREILYAQDICNAEKFERIEEIMADKEVK